jgi:hypothetical protein
MQILAEDTEPEVDMADEDADTVQWDGTLLPEVVDMALEDEDLEPEDLEQMDLQHEDLQHEDL